MKYFLIVSVSLLFISCSKDNTTATQTSGTQTSGTQTSKDSTCQIVSVKWVEGTDSFTTNLSYDSTGKLSKTVDGLGKITKYRYSDNQIFITMDGDPGNQNITVLNNFGYVDQFDVSTDYLSFYSAFFYTSDTVLSFTVFKSLQLDAPDTTSYHFTDGDLTSTVAGGSTNNYTYYPDKPEQPADLSFYDQIISQGALAYENKHLTKSYSGSSFDQQYTYTFDTGGRILSITDNYVNGQTSGTITYYYTYGCHL